MVHLFTAAPCPSFLFLPLERMSPFPPLASSSCHHRPSHQNAVGRTPVIRLSDLVVIRRTRLQEGFAYDLACRCLVRHRETFGVTFRRFCPYRISSPYVTHCCNRDLREYFNKLIRSKKRLCVLVFQSS